MNEATERATYYEQNKERIAQQQRTHREIPEVKGRIRERERLTKRSVDKTLEIHEELLKHDNERLKPFFIKEQIAIVKRETINTNKIDNDR